MKICGTCKVAKSTRDFNVNQAKKDGLQSECRPCSNASSRKYYTHNREKHKKEVSRRKKQCIKYAQQQIIKFLSKNPCVDCGTDDVRVLEFDHLPEYEKSKTISAMVGGGWSWEAIQQEIAKCEVVCANCHRIRTYDRSGCYRVTMGT